MQCMENITSFHLEMAWDYLLVLVTHFLHVSASRVIYCKHLCVLFAVLIHKKSFHNEIIFSMLQKKKKSQIEDEEYYCNRKMVRTKKAYNFVNRGWEEAFGIEFLGSESEGFSFLILKTLLAMSTTQKEININNSPLQHSFDNSISRIESVMKDAPRNIGCLGEVF